MLSIFNGVHVLLKVVKIKKLKIYCHRCTRCIVFHFNRMLLTIYQIASGYKVGKKSYQKELENIQREFILL